MVFISNASFVELYLWSFNDSRIDSITVKSSVITTVNWDWHVDNRLLAAIDVVVVDVSSRRTSVGFPLLLPFDRRHIPPRLDSCSLDGTTSSTMAASRPWKQRKPPKYSALNGVNVSLMCQSYPAALRDLSFNPDGGVLDREGTSDRIDSEVAPSRCLLQPTAGPCDRPATRTRRFPRHPAQCRDVGYS
jgi:hypothetical protein